MGRSIAVNRQEIQTAVSIELILLLCRVGLQENVEEKKAHVAAEEEEPGVDVKKRFHRRTMRTKGLVYPNGLC